MITKIIYLFKRFAWFKRLNAKVTYELLARYIPAEDWQFMNYGYVPNADEKPFEVPTDELKIQQYSLQMYHYLASKTTIAGKHILEIGSGRGGGARYIAQYLEPTSYVGVDIAQNAVTLANKLHKLPNLKFIQGSGESLPLQDNSVDVVINVESCHGYGNVKSFLSEVKRVLKPEGLLLLVDFRNSVENMQIFKQQLSESGLELLEEQNISNNVINAIEAEDESKIKRIEKLIPPKFQKLFCDFAGVVDSKFHQTLKNRTRPYYRFVLKKSIA